MMEYHDNSEPAYRDYGQMAQDEAAPGIPAEDVDAALRRIEEAVDGLPVSAAYAFRPWLRRIFYEERERLGLPKEANV